MEGTCRPWRALRGCWGGDRGPAISRGCCPPAPWLGQSSGGEQQVSPGPWHGASCTEFLSSSPHPSHPCGRVSWSHHRACPLQGPLTLWPSGWESLLGGPVQVADRHVTTDEARGSEEFGGQHSLPEGTLQRRARLEREEAEGGLHVRPRRAQSLQACGPC